jgi:hypothetical protein
LYIFYVVPETEFVVVSRGWNQGLPLVSLVFRPALARGVVPSPFRLHQGIWKGPVTVLLFSGTM